MKRYSNILSSILIVFLSVVISGCKVANQASTSQATNMVASKKLAKNVIFMVGDGMGLTQITAAMISNGYHLNLEKMPITGLHKSYSYDNLITDSAAGATAFSCGVKTYNAAIGVDKDTVAIETITEEAHKMGKKTGIVVTSTIVHATPASFIAHNAHRNNYEAIAKDVVDCGVDILIGGGKKYFDRRKDGKDLLEQMKMQGYNISSFIDTEKEQVRFEANKKYFYLSADADPLPVEQGRDYLQSLSLKTVDALNASNSGFVLMIEGSQIDWGGHANNVKYMASELLDFDKTIGDILDWVNKNGETLLVITADHETGGLSINGGTTLDSLSVSFASTHHSGTMIPVFAAGPGSELFSGIYQNTDIYDKMREALGWKKRVKPVVLDVKAGR